MAVWDPFTTPIITAVAGKVKFGDLIIGKTLKEKVDLVTSKIKSDGCGYQSHWTYVPEFPSRMLREKPP